MKRQKDIRTSYDFAHIISYLSRLSCKPSIIDSTVRGPINNKKPAKIYELIEALASNNYERGADFSKKSAGVLDGDEVTSLKSQMSAQ